LDIKGIALLLVGSLIVICGGVAAADTPETHRWVTALKAGAFLGDVSGPVILYPSLSYRLHPRHAVGLGAAWEYSEGLPEGHVIIMKAEYRTRPFTKERDITYYFNAGGGITVPAHADFAIFTASAGIGKDYRISDSFGLSWDLGLRGMYVLFGAGVALEAALGISD
jgi:hypothetical protein